MCEIAYDNAWHLVTVQKWSRSFIIFTFSVVKWKAQCPPHLSQSWGSRWTRACKRHRFRVYGIYLVVVMATDFGVPVFQAFFQIVTIVLYSPECGYPTVGDYGSC